MKLIIEELNALCGKLNVKQFNANILSQMYKVMLFYCITPRLKELCAAKQNNFRKLLKNEYFNPDLKDEILDNICIDADHREEMLININAIEMQATYLLSKLFESSKNDLKYQQLKELLSGNKKNYVLPTILFLAIKLSTDSVCNASFFANIFTLIVAIIPKDEIINLELKLLFLLDFKVNPDLKSVEDMQNKLHNSEPSNKRLRIS